MQGEIIFYLWGEEWFEENYTADTEDAAFASGSVAISQHSHLEKFVHPLFFCLLVHLPLQVKELKQPEAQLY